jgi:hypothetical protein
LFFSVGGQRSKEHHLVEKKPVSRIRTPVSYNLVYLITIIIMGKKCIFQGQSLKIMVVALFIRKKKILSGQDSNQIIKLQDRST